MKAGTRTAWTFVITSIALFMVVLDNLVVSTALPVIRVDLGASIEQLEWIVNAYTFTFAVFLLTGAALGDRFGRKRMFMIGLAIFTGASALAALAPSTEWLIAARALQGIGGAIVTPLTLTILSAAVSAERRGAALGAWSGIAGFAVAMGPLVGGAVVEGISWQWMFWLNVPVGLILLPLATQLRESYGPDKPLDIPGVALGGLGLLGLVWGLVNGNSDGWTSPQIVGSLVVGAVILAAFVGWELRTKEPMLPMRFFRDRAFSAANGASLFMYFGMFGSIFLLTQFFQTAQGYSPLEAGLRVLPWTAMPMFVAPDRGRAVRSDRRRAHHGRRPRSCRRRASPGSRPSRTRRSATARSSARSSSPGSGWACSSRPSRTSSSPPSGRSRRARPRARTTRSARSGACSASPYSPPSSRATAATSRPRRSTTVSSSPRGSARAVGRRRAVLALLIPPKRRTDSAHAAELVPNAEAA